MSSHNVGFTKIDVRKTKFTWKIDNIKHLTDCIGTGNKLESPTFTIKPEDDLQWKLWLWPKGFNNSCEEFMSAALSCTATNKYDAHVKFSISVINTRGEKCYEQRADTDNIINSSHTFNQLFKRNVLEFDSANILQNDVFTLHCELAMLDKSSMKNVEESLQHVPSDDIDKILNAFEQQLEKQEFSDVKLVASCGKELPAHKFVLTAHSPVFSAMFTNDMKEKNNHSVVIKDLDYDSLKEMLRFMYCGRVENLNVVSSGVLLAQEKYQIDGLKELFEKYFFNNINIENAIEILALSIRYGMDKTKLLSKKFIRCHAKNVSNSAGFKAIDEPNLLAEIVQILANV